VRLLGQRSQLAAVLAAGLSLRIDRSARCFGGLALLRDVGRSGAQVLDGSA
jgi:hypothetical protein